MQTAPDFLENFTVYVQTLGSNECGIYAVAHYCGIEPQDALFACLAANNKRNFKSGATTRHLHKGLSWLGYRAPQHCLLLAPGTKPPNKCIICMRWIEPGTERHGIGHWAVYDHGYIICSGPAMAGIFEFNKYISTRNGCYTCYLPIEKFKQ